MSIDESVQKVLDAIKKVKQAEKEKQTKKAKQNAFKHHLAPCVIIDEFGLLDEEGKPRDR